MGDDIFVQGSRAAGTAKAGSDIDIAIRVSPERFAEIINDPKLVQKALYAPNPGSANAALRETAISQGRIHAGEARLSGVAERISQNYGRPVQISIVKAGGKFDNGAQTPLAFDFR